jgi:hypothetical protein
MLDSGHVTGATGCASEMAAPPPNTTTETELLSRAREAIEAGESSLRIAAEALALAREDFKTTQREMAAAVGKSVAWVNQLLHWQREGCPGTPFGPGSRSSRERRKRVQATEQQAPRNAHADDAQASAEGRKAEYAKEEAETLTSTVKNPLEGFKSAVDYWFPKLDYSGKCEAVRYAITKGKVKVSWAS